MKKLLHTEGVWSNHHNILNLVPIESYKNERERRLYSCKIFIITANIIMESITNTTTVRAGILNSMYVLNSFICEWNKVLNTNVSVYQTET